MVAVAVLALAVPARVVAQCPNGVPPPCPGAAGPAANSVAVLYFTSLSRDSNDAYLADGLTEEIIERLGSVARLAVKSRFEVQQLRGRAPADPLAMGHTLKATWLVTGSVQRGGARIRVRAELIRAATRARVWGEQFDQPAGDVLAIEEAIARGVVQGVVGTLLPAERTTLAARTTTDTAAYDLYLRGRVAFNRGDLRSAIPLLQRAVAEDSTFARAWAALSFAWGESADSWRAPREAYPQAQAAAERALALDSTSAEAWTALAMTVLPLNHDAPLAERLARRAVSLAPSLPEAYVALGFTQWAFGRGRDALEAFRRAWELDTLSRYTTEYYRIGLAASGSREELRRLGERTGEVRPVARVALGECAGALDDVSRSRQSYGALIRVLALTCLGRTDDIRPVIDTMKTTAGRQYFNPYPIAAAYAAVGERDSAYAWLERTLDDRTSWYLGIPFDRFWDPFRSDPRFLALMTRFGLPAARVN